MIEQNDRSSTELLKNQAERDSDHASNVTSINQLCCSLDQFVLAMWSSLQQNYEAVFKPLKPLISKELAVFLFHGRVFSQGVFREVFTVL